MDSKAVISWLAVVGRPTTSVAIGGVATTTAAGALLAPVPLTGVSASGTAGMLISKARVSWVGVTPRNIREVSVVGVSSKVSQGVLTTPVPITSVSTRGVSGYLVSRARVSWINISQSQDKSVSLSAVTSQALAGELVDPSANLAPRMRIIYRNLADSAQVQASTAYAAFPAENLQNDTKSRPHRSTGTRVVYTLTWQEPAVVGAVALPATNLTAGATIRVRLYADAAEAGQLGDSGVKLACPTPSAGIYGEGPAVDRTKFAYGAESRSCVWFVRQRAGVLRCVVEIEDPFNPAGFIEVSRLVVGPYWQAERNPSYGAEMLWTDSTESRRLLSGDLSSRRGTMSSDLRIKLEDMSEGSRAELAKITRSGGNKLVSMFPEYELTEAVWQMCPPEMRVPSAPPYVSSGYVQEGYVVGGGEDQKVLPPSVLAAARSMEHDHTLFGRLRQGTATMGVAGWTVELAVAGW